MDKILIDELNDRFHKIDPEIVLSYFLKEYKGKIALSSSLGLEDQILTHMICQIDKNTKIFTLDTGRLFPETYDLIEETNKKYDTSIETYFPDALKVENMVKEKGINLFYESIENRKLCCSVRKLSQLPRAFEGIEAWITGIRKDQSLTRFYTKLIEWDEKNNLLKINPLLNFSDKDVKKYIKDHYVPYNKLHDQGFPSIGCQPCSRAIRPGEDIRAGRWWWEEPEHKECGLHQR